MFYSDSRLLYADFCYEEDESDDGVKEREYHFESSAWVNHSPKIHAISTTISALRVPTVSSHWHPPLCGAPSTEELVSTSVYYQPLPRQKQKYRLDESSLTFHAPQLHIFKSEYYFEGRETLWRHLWGKSLIITVFEILM